MISLLDVDEDEGCLEFVLFVDLDAHVFLLK